MNDITAPNMHVTQDEILLEDDDGVKDLLEYLMIYRAGDLVAGKIVKSAHPHYGTIFRADLLTIGGSAQPVARVIRWEESDASWITKIIVSSALAPL